MATDNEISNGLEPVKAIKNALSNSDLILIGENHKFSFMQDSLCKIIKELGIDCVALEIQAKYQERLDAGDFHSLAWPSYGFLSACGEAGIKLLCVDNDFDSANFNCYKNKLRGEIETLISGYKDRDEKMSDNIIKYMRNNPCKKVLFFGGASHISRLPIYGYYPDRTKETCGFFLNKKGISFVNFGYLTFNDASIIKPFSCVLKTSDVKEPGIGKEYTKNLLGYDYLWCLFSKISKK